LPDDQVISRAQVRVRASPEDSSKVELIQVGRHGVIVYRLSELGAAGWMKSEDDDTVDQPSSSRARSGRTLQKDEYITLNVGDAFGVRGTPGICPFFVTAGKKAGEKEEKEAVNSKASETAPAKSEHRPSSKPAVMAPNAESALSAETRPPPLTPPRSGPPSRRPSMQSQSSPPSRSSSYVSCASLSPHHGSRKHPTDDAGPISSFYHSYRADSLRDVRQVAQEMDGGVHQPTVVDKLLQQADNMKEEQRVQDEAQDGTKVEKSEWSLDLYPASKRRRLMPADRVRVENGKLHILPETALRHKPPPRYEPTLNPSPDDSAGASASPPVTDEPPVVQPSPSPPPLPSASPPAIGTDSAMTNGRIVQPSPIVTSPPNPPAATTSPFIPVSPIPRSPPSPPPSPPAPPPTIVLPSFSTQDFQFDPEKANPIAELAFVTSWTSIRSVEIFV